MSEGKQGDAPDPFTGLLADTWWFGLTSRLSPGRFTELSVRRVEQGFNAVQLVVGIPPEIGPLNENARSDAGFPWSMDGEFNAAYLALARDRIAQLNATGLSVIIYGAWGHQIAWLGREGMARWWSRLVESVDDLDVVYCLTGEINLWIGDESRLLLEGTSVHPAVARITRRLPGRLRRVARRIRSTAPRLPSEEAAAARRNDWGFVLERLAGMTRHPIIVHTQPGEMGMSVLDNAHLLAANSIQSGHSEERRADLWRIPMREKRAAPHRPFLNLEPWYEGITDRFGPADQLYAYWVTMLAGASGYCYGAHGIWNVGDGRFLSHWGGQTFNEALALDTPRLIGRSHRLWMDWNTTAEPFNETHDGRLTVIGRRRAGREIRFYPRIEEATGIPEGRFWLPLAGDYAATRPNSGPVVILTEG